MPCPAPPEAKHREMPPSLLERYRGCLLGLACGDALGTSVEFMPRGSFKPLTDMLGGGPFGLRAGQWTDDTSMALCLAESLLSRAGFDARDQMARYLNWWQWGYLSSTGECFDIGMTVRDALTRFQQNGEPFAGSHEPNTAGNGSLMRLAPVVLFFHPQRKELLARCADSSRTTHAAPEAVECCMLFGLILSEALSGATRAELLQQDPTRFDEPAVAALARGDYLARSAEQIVGSGYSVASLTAALWCFQHSDSFEAAVLLAANLGDDADTTAAITGQLAGAYYGVQGIPAHWLARLHMHDEIQQTADQLLRAAQARNSICSEQLAQPSEGKRNQ